MSVCFHKRTFNELHGGYLYKKKDLLTITGQPKSAHTVRTSIRIIKKKSRFSKLKTWHIYFNKLENSMFKISIESQSLSSTYCSRFLNSNFWLLGFFLNIINLLVHIEISTFARHNLVILLSSFQRLKFDRYLAWLSLLSIAFRNFQT